MAEKKKKEMMAEEAAMKSKDTMAKKDAMAKDAMMDGAYVIKRGDNLWNIAKSHYGDGAMWTRIKMANDVGSGRILTVGETLMLPK